MQYSAAINVSVELPSVCVSDAEGKIVKEAKVVSDPERSLVIFKGPGFEVERIGIEAAKWDPILGPSAENHPLPFTRQKDLAVLSTRTQRPGKTASQTTPCLAERSAISVSTRRIWLPQ
jgi:hypothetical protein